MTILSVLPALVVILHPFRIKGRSKIPEEYYIVSDFYSRIDFSPECSVGLLNGIDKGSKSRVKCGGHEDGGGWEVYYGILLHLLNAIFFLLSFRCKFVYDCDTRYRLLFTEFDMVGMKNANKFIFFLLFPLC